MDQYSQYVLIEPRPSQPMVVETRRLSNTRKSGTGSFILNVPKEWCNTHKLQPGSEVQLYIDELAPGTILIQTGQSTATTNLAEINLDDREHKTRQARRRAILGGYLEGYNAIRLGHVSRKSKERLDIREDIMNLSQKLDGCSVSEDSTSFELTMVTTVKSPLELLERLYNTTREMFSDVFRAYLEFEEDLSKDIVQRDDGADKLYFAIVRMLKIILKQPFQTSTSDFKLEDVLDYRMVSSQLENLADAAEYVAQAILGINNEDHQNISSDESSQLTKKQRNRITAIADVLSDTLDEAYTAYRENDEPTAVRMAQRRNEMEEYHRELADFGVHSSLLHVIDEAKETIVDLLELVHADPEVS